MWNKIKPYIISVLIALGIGGLSAFFTRNNMNVFDNIIKPPLTPPMWLFPVVWGILFILMGIGAAIVFVKCGGNKEICRDALFFYSLQLIVNFFWSLIFFNMQSYLFAFIWLLLLLALIIIMIIKFYKISPLAAYLQIPYALWVAFAGYLNLAIFLLNR